jgi:hypothetical protein
MQMIDISLRSPIMLNLQQLSVHACVSYCSYADLAFAVPSPRPENIKLITINNDLGFEFVIPDS